LGLGVLLASRNKLDDAAQNFCLAFDMLGTGSESDYTAELRDLLQDNIGPEAFDTLVRAIASKRGHAS
jgi:hypothetical protein